MVNETALLSSVVHFRQAYWPGRDRNLGNDQWNAGFWRGAGGGEGEEIEGEYQFILIFPQVDEMYSKLLFTSCLC